MSPTKKCEFCDTILEFESDGRRMIFAAHDASSCQLAARERLRMMERLFRQAAENRAEVESSLRRRLHRQDIEIDLLRETVYEAARGRGEIISSIEDPEVWEARVARRIEDRKIAEAVRLVEAQRLSLLPLTTFDIGGAHE